MKKKLRLWNKDVPWYMNFHIRPVTINGYVFLAIVLFSAWAYSHDVEAYKEVYEAPCNYCNLLAACAGTGGEQWTNIYTTNNYSIDFWQTQNLTAANIR